MDITIYCVIIVAIVFRLIIMKGSFVLPTFYRNGREVSFNLGSITTIIIGIAAAIGLGYAQPELFANPYVAFVTAYTAPQITDGVITAGTRYITGNKQVEEIVVEHEKEEQIDAPIETAEIEEDEQ